MSRSILVLGDVMVDRHFFGQCHRISPESPVPIVNIHDKDIVTSLGGAANVSAHISRTGIKCILAYKSFVPPVNNNYNEIFLSMCDKENVKVEPLDFGIISSISVKERIWAGNQQVVRIDNENADPPNKQIESEWINKIIGIINNNNVGCVIMSDYSKGCLTDQMIQNVAHYCYAKKIPTILDPKRPTYYKIKNISIIKPNSIEVKITNHDAKFLSDELDETYLVNTLGKDGMKVYRDAEEIFFYPALTDQKYVVDITGLGDTCCSILGLSLYYGIDIKNAVVAASKGASIGIRHKGSYCLSKLEMESCFNFAEKYNKE